MAFEGAQIVEWRLVPEGKAHGEHIHQIVQRLEAKRQDLSPQMQAEQQRHINILEDFGVVDSLDLRLLGREPSEGDFTVTLGSPEDMRSGQEEVRCQAESSPVENSVIELEGVFPLIPSTSHDC